jgi:hypothetical protein
MQNRIRIRLVLMRGYNIYAVMLYINKELDEICFHSELAAKAIERFEQHMLTIPNMDGISNAERRLIFERGLAFCDHIDETKSAFTKIAAANVLVNTDNNSLQTLWQLTKGKNVVNWEELVNDVEIKRTPIPPPPPPPPSQRAQIKGQNSILGFNALAPGGPSQEPMPMSPGDLEKLRRGEKLPDEPNWNEYDHLHK